jgi:hypothetical protein
MLIDEITESSKRTNSRMPSIRMGVSVRGDNDTVWRGLHAEHTRVPKNKKIQIIRRDKV